MSTSKRGGTVSDRPNRGAEDRPTSPQESPTTAQSSPGTGAEGVPVSGAPGTSTGGARLGAVASRQSAKSAGQLMKEVSEDFSNLFRAEIELAKIELTESITAKAKGAAIIGIAGVFGFFALIFVLLAVRDGLDAFLWEWVADLLTALLLGIVGGIAVLVARRFLRVPVKAEMTKQTIREDMEWAKTLGKS